MANKKTPVTWLRNFGVETQSPIEGKMTGQIPEWLKGALLRNGAGIYRIGETSMKHLFDGMAVMHRFEIRNGKATYQNRILQSDTYLESKAANRLTTMQYGTAETPDPCKSLLGRFMSRFELPDQNDLTDNCCVNIAAYGDALYAVTESFKIRKIDPETLETIGEKTSMKDYVAVNTATAHPHIDEDGTVYNMGNSNGSQGPMYNIVEFPPGKSSFNEARIVTSLPARWKLNPSYYHSFAITENYFVFVECPVTMNVLKLATMNLRKGTFGSSLGWFAKERARFMVVERKTGKLVETKYEAPAFFTFHHGNAYEKDGHLIVDMSHYNDSAILDDLMIENLERDKGDFSCGRYTRFVLPLDVKVPDSEKQYGVNLITLEGVKSKSYWLKKNIVFCEPDQISDRPIELPRINYVHNGKYYRYVYGISQKEGSSENIQMIKIDTETRKFQLWQRDGYSVSEPVFVARPQATEEDDGLVLFSALHHSDDKRVLLVILEARTFEEVACTEFIAKDTVTKDFHGIFYSNNDTAHRF